MANSHFHCGGFVGRTDVVPAIIGNHHDYFSRAMVRALGVSYEEWAATEETSRAEVKSQLEVQREAFDKAIAKVNSAIHVMINSAYAPPKRPRTGDIEQMIEDIDRVEKTRATKLDEMRSFILTLVAKNPPVRLRR